MLLYQFTKYASSLLQQMHEIVFFLLRKSYGKFYSVTQIPLELVLLSLSTVIANDSANYVVFLVLSSCCFFLVLLLLLWVLPDTNKDRLID